MDTISPPGKIEYASPKRTDRSVVQRRVMGWVIAAAIAYGLFRSIEEVNELLEGWYIPEPLPFVHITQLLMGLIAAPLILLGGLLLMKFQRAGRWVLLVGTVLLLFEMAMSSVDYAMESSQSSYFMTLRMLVRICIPALGAGALLIIMSNPTWRIFNRVKSPTDRQRRVARGLVIAFVGLAVSLPLLDIAQVQGWGFFNGFADTSTRLSRQTSISEAAIVWLYEIQESVYFVLPVIWLAWAIGLHRSDYVGRASVKLALVFLLTLLTVCLLGFTMTALIIYSRGFYLPDPTNVHQCLSTYLFWLWGEISFLPICVLVSPAFARLLQKPG